MLLVTSTLLISIQWNIPSYTVVTDIPCLYLDVVNKTVQLIKARVTSIWRYVLCKRHSNTSPWRTHAHPGLEGNLPPTQLPYVLCIFVNILSLYYATKIIIVFMLTSIFLNLNRLSFAKNFDIVFDVRSGLIRKCKQLF